MHPAINDYLTRVMTAADLATGDETSVREELADHLSFLDDGIQPNSMTHEEIHIMIENQFGNADEVGQEISKAKGRFRTYLKKQARKAPAAIGIAIVLALVVKWQFAEAYTVASSSMEPVLPQHAYVLVNKWSGYTQGDLIVFHDDNGRSIIAHLDTLDESEATVSKYNPGTDQVNQWPKKIDPKTIIGRVWIVRR